jgi:hypothetical protein
VDRLGQFISDLSKLLHENGYAIKSSLDIDLIDERESGHTLVGYWPSTCDVESFRKLK